MSKKLFQILAVLMAFALLSGCVVPTPAAPAEQPAAEEPAAEEPAAEPESKGEIVFIPKSTSATFYLFLVKGAQDKAEELGYTIDYLGPATEADIAAQVDLVRNVTTKKPAGILLAALDSEALIPPVEEAMAAAMGGRDPATLPQEQVERMRTRIAEQLAEGQRVPMMRVMTHQALPVMRVQPFNRYQRNRYYN